MMMMPQFCVVPQYAMIPVDRVSQFFLTRFMGLDDPLTFSYDLHFVREKK